MKEMRQMKHCLSSRASDLIWLSAEYIACHNEYVRYLLRTVFKATCLSYTSSNAMQTWQSLVAAPTLQRSICTASVCVVSQYSRPMYTFLSRLSDSCQLHALCMGPLSVLRQSGKLSLEKLLAAVLAICNELMILDLMKYLEEAELSRAGLKCEESCMRVWGTLVGKGTAA